MAQIGGGGSVMSPPQILLREGGPSLPPLAPTVPKPRGRPANRGRTLLAKVVVVPEWQWPGPKTIDRAWPIIIELTPVWRSIFTRSLPLTVEPDIKVIFSFDRIVAPTVLTEPSLTLTPRW